MYVKGQLEKLTELLTTKMEYIEEEINNLKEDIRSLAEENKVIIELIRGGFDKLLETKKENYTTMIKQSKTKKGLVVNETTKEQQNEHNEQTNEKQETEVSSTPQFVINPMTLIVNEGEVFRLPCVVDRLEGFVIIWKKNSVVITVHEQIIDNQKVRLEKVDNGNTLIFGPVSSEDEGDYTCVISAFQPTELHHSVQIRGELLGAPQSLMTSISLYNGTQYQYFKVQVPHGKTVTNEVVVETCRDAYMYPVCHGPAGCHLSSSECSVTPLSDGCYTRPMGAISMKLCQTDDAIKCPALDNVYQYENKIGAVGSIEGVWIVGEDVTSTRYLPLFAFCGKKI